MKRNRIYVMSTAILLGVLAMISNEAGRILLILSSGLTVLISLIYYFGLPGKLKCRLVLPNYRKEKENIVGELQVVHGGFFPIFYGKAFFRIENLLTGETEEFDLSITLMRKEEGSSSFDFDLIRSGIVQVKLLKIELYGLLGCIKKSIPVSLGKEVMVLPDTFEPEISLRPVLRMNEEGEKTVRARRGFDPGIYDGIRPFRDGDSIKNIHWKLTGKTGEYMVRELGMPAVMLPVLYLETVMEQNTPDMINALMETYVSLSQRLVEEGFRHCLCWYDERRGQWIWHKVSEIAHLDESFGLLLRAGFKKGESPHFFEIEQKEWEQYGQIIVISNVEADYGVSAGELLAVTLLYGRRQKERSARGEHIYPFGISTLRKDLYRLEL